MNEVVHVTDATAAGVLRVLVGYANGQVAQGQSVTVLWVRRDETPDDLASQFDSRVALREVRGPTRLFALWRAAGSARDIAKEDPGTVIHAHSTRAGVAVRVRAIVAGFSRNVVYSPHGFGFLREDLPAPLRFLLKAAERGLARGCRRLILVSPSELRVARDVARAEKLAVVPNSVNLQPVNSHLRRSSSGEVPCVITVGRITAQKAPERFAAVALALSDRAQFMWVGDGDPAARAELERAGVTVTGWLDGEHVASRLAQADAFVLLSRWEGMPLALLEAQALGLPSVASNVVGNTDVVVDGSTGFLVSGDTAARVAVDKLISSVDLRLRMGKNARVNARRYTPAVTIAALSDAYSREDSPL